MKNKEIIININHKEFLKTLKFKNLNLTIKKNLLVSLKQRTKELKKHFIEDKWDLDTNLIIDDILLSTFGIDLNWFITLYILSKIPNLRYIFTENKFIFRLKENSSGQKGFRRHARTTSSRKSTIKTSNKVFTKSNKKIK